MFFGRSLPHLPSEEAYRFLGEAICGETVPHACQRSVPNLGINFKDVYRIFLCTFQTVAEQLIDAVDLSSAHNYSLLLLWASQANAVPVRAGVCTSLVPTQPGIEAIVCVIDLTTV